MRFTYNITRPSPSSFLQGHNFVRENDVAIKRTGYFAYVYDVKGIINNEVRMSGREVTCRLHQYPWRRFWNR